MSMHGNLPSFQLKLLMKIFYAQSIYLDTQSHNSLYV